MLSIREKLVVIHRAWRYRLKTEPDEIALVRKLVNPGDFVLDIGANKAAFTYWMAKCVGPNGKVFSFEPIPDLAAYLREVSEWMAGYDIEIHECALSNENGTQKLHFPGHHLGTASLEIKGSVFRDPVEVTKWRLDDLISPEKVSKPISFIKCDVESHELAVFQGGAELLKRDKPIILFESGNLLNGQKMFEPAFEFLESIGYAGCFIDQGELVKLSDYNPQKHKIDSVANQNFLFTNTNSA